MAYLDDTGLAYFWGKIKAWANSVFALISHTHSSSDVTLMTGYSMPASTGAISSGDTLNQAVGKLEKAMDAADISNAVHRTGNETVGGEKTFTGPLSRTSNISGMIVRHQSLTRGTVPSEDAYFNIPFCDGSGAEWAGDGAHGRFGLLEVVVASNGVVRTRLAAYRNAAGSATAHGISVSVDSSGDGFATAPSTSPDRATGTDILTRDWIPKDIRIVHTSGNEEISGNKTFNSIVTTNSFFSARTAGIASGSYSDVFRVYSDAGTRCFLIRTNPDGDANGNLIHTDLLSLKEVNDTVVWGGVLTLGRDSSDVPFCRCTSPAATGDPGDIVTRSFLGSSSLVVHTTGNETIQGTKTFRTYPIVKSTNLSRDVINTDIVNTIFRFEDLNSKRFFYINCRRYDTDYKNRTQFLSFNKNDDYGSIICDFTDAGNYTVSVMTSVSGASATLAATYLRANSFTSSTSDALSRNSTSSMLIMRGGTVSDYSGATLSLYGATRSVRPGYFYLNATTSSSANKSLEGRPDGTLLWNGQTVQTSSDERLKTPLAAVPDDVLDAWLGVEWGQFQFLDAVAEKGGSARLHAGLIAQSVDRAFAGAGLDACRYGILCHEFRGASDAEEEETVQEAFTDLDGTFHPAVKRTRVFHEDAVDLWTVRYAEALCMEAACMRRENARLKKRVSDLEERLAALELRLGSE